MNSGEINSFCPLRRHESKHIVRDFCIEVPVRDVGGPLQCRRPDLCYEDLLDEGLIAGLNPDLEVPVIFIEGEMICRHAADRVDSHIDTVSDVACHMLTEVWRSPGPRGPP